MCYRLYIYGIVFGSAHWYAYRQAICGHPWDVYVNAQYASCTLTKTLHCA